MSETLRIRLCEEFWSSVIFIFTCDSSEMRYGFLPKPQGHKDQGIDLNCPRLHGIFLSHINMKSQISQLNYIIQYNIKLYYT